MDVAYARGWSLGLDLRLLFRTPLELLATARDRMIQPLERSGHADGRRTACPRRRRRPRLLGPEPRPQPPRARRTPRSLRSATSDVRARSSRSRGAIRRSGRTTSSTRSSRTRAIDAVAIATPVSTHFALAPRRSRPASTSSSRSRSPRPPTRRRELIELAERRGLVLMPGHTFLYSPPVNCIRDAASQAGELGEIYFISTSRVNLGLHQPDVSVVWDLGPHDFSILRYWLDETPQPRRARSAAAASSPRSPTSRSSTSSSRRGRSRTSSCRGSRRASSAGRRSSARGRWSSTTTRASSRCGSSTPASCSADPEDVRRVPADLPHRRHRLAAGRPRPSRSARAERLLSRDPSGETPARRRYSASRSCPRR